MENGKTDKIEVPTLQGVDLWRAILEENDRRYIQKHILSETSFESSGDESEESDSSSSTSNLSECIAIQRTLELENSFSSDDNLDLSVISISSYDLHLWHRIKFDQPFIYLFTLSFILSSHTSHNTHNLVESLLHGLSRLFANDPSQCEHVWIWHRNVVWIPRVNTGVLTRLSPCDVLHL